MENIKEGFMEDLRGYAEEYPDWLNTWIESALIGFGLSCLVFLFTVLVCSQL